jgi:hypothetical protein
MASVPRFSKGDWTRTSDLRILSFASRAGATDTTFMLARVPLLLQFRGARMSSMPRAKNAVGIRGLLSTENYTSLRDSSFWSSATSIADGPSPDQHLMRHDELGFAGREADG